MPKTKRSHHRSAERRTADGDELSNQSVVWVETWEFIKKNIGINKKKPINTITTTTLKTICLFRSDDSDQVVEQKKRHRKKSSKKGKKHRSKRKHSPSDSDSDSSDSSESSSDSSSEEEVVKRKKSKKHKKNKRRRHETTGERKADREDIDVEILHEPPKVHYISSDEERQQHAKQLKRTTIDDRKRPTNSKSNDYKSKWDSPNDEFERKRWDTSVSNLIVVWMLLWLLLCLYTFVSLLSKIENEA